MAIMAENDAIANKNLLPSSNLRSNQRELFFIRNCWQSAAELFNANELNQPCRDFSCQALRPER